MISEKQLLANRRNAVKSTGPRTEEGKARSRVNAARHGLAGAGIALPEGDRDKYARRLGKWSEQLGPRDDVEAYLVQSAALASVRLDRCMNGELALVDGKRCETIASWEQAQEVKRQAIVRDSQGHIQEVVPQLMTFSTGCEWLMFQWEIVREELLTQGYLHENNLEGAQQLRTLEGAYSDSDLVQLNERARNGGPDGEEARVKLAQFIDAELDTLETLRDQLWVEKEAPLVRQVLEEEAFDASPRAMLMRRYETACRNDLHRSLRDLARIRKEDLLHSHAPRPASAADPDPQAAAPAPQPAPAESPQLGFRNEAISSTTPPERTPYVTQPTPRHVRLGRAARRKAAARQREQALAALEPACSR